jgi:hypothetical protein|tara:strand:+ start:216 stop:464 length:249 start_codon:yes stop_codon:yes gene_type:complete
VKDDKLREEINDIIEADIQIALNDYIEKEGAQGLEGQKLNAKVSKSEVEKIIKEYKRIKKEEKSNLGQIKKLGLVDQHGRQL